MKVCVFLCGIVTIRAPTWVADVHDEWTSVDQWETSKLDPQWHLGVYRYTLFYSFSTCHSVNKLFPVPSLTSCILLLVVKHLYSSKWCTFLNLSSVPSPKEKACKNHFDL